MKKFKVMLSCTVTDVYFKEIEIEAENSNDASLQALERQANDEELIDLGNWELSGPSQIDTTVISTKEK